MGSEDLFRRWTEGEINMISLYLFVRCGHFEKLEFDLFLFCFQIFTEDLTEVETLPRDKVLNFLKEGFKELAIPYLEHIIYMWDETRPEFHNVLIQLYLEKVQGLMKVYLNSLPEGQTHSCHSHCFIPAALGVLLVTII